MRIVHSNGVVHNFLDKSDVHFREPHQTLDTVCSDLHSKGVGAEKKSATVISFEDEGLLGKSYVIVPSISTDTIELTVRLIFVDWFFFRLIFVFAFYLIISISHFNE